MDRFNRPAWVEMGLRRLAKDADSKGKAACPALYATDDPVRMVAQGVTLTAAETGELVEARDEEAAVALPTETVFRGMARYAIEHGDDDLATRIEAFVADRGL